jgi:hypothetical protein
MKLLFPNAWIEIALVMMIIAKTTEIISAKISLSFHKIKLFKEVQNENEPFTTFIGTVSIIIMFITRG